MNLWPPGRCQNKSTCVWETAHSSTSTSRVAPDHNCCETGAGSRGRAESPSRLLRPVCVFTAGETEVHPSTVPCDDGRQRGGPVPCQGDLHGHRLPAPQQCCQLRAADCGAQGQLEAPVPGLCRCRCRRLSEELLPNPTSPASFPKCVSPRRVCSLGWASVRSAGCGLRPGKAASPPSCSLGKSRGFPSFFFFSFFLIF